MTQTKVPHVNVVVSLSDEIEQMQQTIRDLAFQKYLERGALDGNAIEDWRSAESDLISVPPVNLIEQDDVRMAELDLAGHERDQIHIAADGVRVLVRSNRQPAVSAADPVPQLWVVIDHFAEFDPSLLRVELRGSRLRVLLPAQKKQERKALEKSA